MADHVVDNIRDAVALAERWRAAGSHTWFRGQNRLWPISTTLARRYADPSEVARGERRLAAFCAWIATVPELRHLLAEQHVHALFAILQHYGVPTHYVDFTINPRVAGFFAGAGTEASPGQQGCIMAIDPDRWVGSLRGVAAGRQWPADRWPEKVVVAVPNLWRMEAQAGHFVYLPIEGAERYSPVDRILFAHDGTTLELLEDEIYPTRKSPLEELLDEFFTEEAMSEGMQAARTWAAKWVARGQGIWQTLERPRSSEWLRPGADVHASWRSIPAGWLAYAHEVLAEARDGTAADVAFDPRIPSEARQRTAGAVRRVLDERPDARRRAIDWRLTPAVTVPGAWVARVQRAVQRVWDGVRRLPFTDDQVVDALASTVALGCADVQEHPCFGARIFEPFLGDVLEMELANARDVNARAVMAEATYQAALRPDLADVIVPELLEPRQQLRQVLAPAHLFDFERLVDAFAGELIPTQALMQRSEQAIFFSPARTPIVGSA